MGHLVAPCQPSPARVYYRHLIVKWNDGYYIGTVYTSFITLCI